MINRLTATVCLWLFMVTIGGSQSIESLLQLYNERVPQEKLYIHFDNSVYTSGQTIWYKAYLLKGREPSDLSKNFYMDWFDTDGKFLSRTIAPVLGSCAVGSFAIPSKYAGNHLQVLAYTKWMLNFDSAFLFHKIIPIAQTNQILENQPATVPLTTLRFFPEGGDMVENIAGNIAFKAQNIAGGPVAVAGVINNKNGQVVTNFASQHDGMGKIKLMPVPGEIYTAEWKDPLGHIQYTRLPSAKPDGVIITVNNAASGKTFSIERPGKPEERFKKISIVAHINQRMVFRAVANLTDTQKVTANLSTYNVPSGILQLTLFDAYKQPLAERILFVNNEEYRQQANIHLDTLNLEKRGKNVYEIEIPDSILTSLSVAITDGAINHDTANNIISHLLLSSEIKGYVHNPAYYFSSDEDSAAEYLDLVMLTNGWRRFRWEDVWERKIPALTYQPDTNYLSLAGKIDKLSDNKIKKAEWVNMILVAKDSSKQFIFTPLHPDGSFGEDNLILFDTTKVFYQLNKTSIPQNSHVIIKNTFLPLDSTRSFHALTTWLSDTSGLARIKTIADQHKRLEDLMKQATLKEVIVKAKVKSRLQEMEERYTSGLFQSGNAYQFNMADDQQAGSYSSAFAFLQSRVPGLQISNAYSINPTALWRGSSVSFFLDEFPVDASSLSSITLNNVAYIKVFQPPFFGALGGGAGGAIAVYTKKGGDSKAFSQGLDYTILPGYTPVKQFYSPSYGEQQRTFGETDLRQTIYWNPYIQTDEKNRKVKISFYNNDISHSIHVILEGMSLDGQLVHVSRLLN